MTYIPSRGVNQSACVSFYLLKFPSTEDRRSRFSHFRHSLLDPLYVPVHTSVLTMFLYSSSYIFKGCNLSVCSNIIFHELYKRTSSDNLELPHPSIRILASLFGISPLRIGAMSAYVLNQSKESSSGSLSGRTLGHVRIDRGGGAPHWLYR